MVFKRRPEDSLKSRSLLSLALLALLSSCSKDKSDPSWLGPGDTSPIHQTSTADECRQFIASLPPNFTHGTIEVPEDPSQPGGEKVQVFYYGRFITGRDP